MTTTSGTSAATSFDPGSVDLFTRPDYFDVLAELRATAPVHSYAPNRWAITHHDDVRAISADPTRFCSGKGVLINDPKRDGMDLPGSVLHMDPPEHGAWRRMASRRLTPRAVADMHERVESVAQQVLDRFGPGDEIDVVDDLAGPIPVLVIAELLGIGHADRGDFRRWSDACIESPDEDPTGDAATANLVAVGELLEFLGQQVRARRAAPRDDLLGALVSADVDGRPATDDELVMYCMSLLVAGNETTRTLISGALAALAEHPDQRALLASAPSSIPAAVEECLRWVTPIQQFTRTATERVELRGQVIEPDDWVVLLYASANRDEAAFGPTADRFDVTRFDPERGHTPMHLAFGFGEHLCLGASLARLEVQVFLTRFLSRFATYELSGPPTWTRSTLVRSHATLPVVLA